MRPREKPWKIRGISAVEGEVGGARGMAISRRHWD